MRRLCVLMLLSMLALPCAAASASAPYASLYAALEPGLRLAGFDRLVAVQRIVSKDGSVPPAQIRVVIEARSGRIEVPIGSDGQARFPLSDELLQENPAVTSNQPKGSLSVSVSIEIALPAGPQMSYREVMAAIEQAERALPGLDPRNNDRVIRGLEVQLPSETASATIESSIGEQLLVADQDGFVFLRRDPELAAKNAQVQFSDRPIRIVPLVQRR